MAEENEQMNVRDMLIAALDADKRVDGGVTDCGIFIRSTDPDTGDEVLVPVVAAGYDEGAEAFVIDVGEPD